MRLTICLEGNTEGRVLASVDMEEILKQCKENSISKEAFEKMKSKAHNHGYRQGYSKAIDDCKELTFREVVYCDSLNDRTEFRELAEQLKEQNQNTNIKTR